MACHQRALAPGVRTAARCHSQPSESCFSSPVALTTLTTTTPFGGVMQGQQLGLGCSFTSSLGGERVVGVVRQSLIRYSLLTVRK